jgi:uncharacterized membrane protein
MTDDAELPRFVRLFVAFLKCVPMTELKTLAGIVLLFATALWLAASIVFRLPIDQEVLDTWLLFLTGLLGISSVAQGWKQSVIAKASTLPQKSEP